jgi:hypothetical protein
VAPVQQQMNRDTVCSLPIPTDASMHNSNNYSDKSIDQSVSLADMLSSYQKENEVPKLDKEAQLKLESETEESRERMNRVRKVKALEKKGTKKVF